MLADGLTRMCSVRLCVETGMVRQADLEEIAKEVLRKGRVANEVTRQDDSGNEGGSISFLSCLCSAKYINILHTSLVPLSVFGT